MPTAAVDFLFGSAPRRIAVAVVLVIVALAAGIGSFLAPKKGGFDFSLNQKISASSSLRLTFPERMDKSSVEKYLAMPKGFEAEREWTDNTLALRPKQRPTPGESYLFVLDARAEKADGTPLGRELTYTFTVTGSPVVAAELPAPDTNDVPVDAEVTIVFDRPVVPLSQVQGKAASARFTNWPVELSPPVKGLWKWLGTTTATFIPSQKLQLATKYTVKVPAGIETVSGDKTEQDFRWSFGTERPRVLGSAPANGASDAGPATELTFFFNQEMDLISAKDSIVLTEGKNPLRAKSVHYGKVPEEPGKLVTDKKAVVFVPEKPYDWQKTYTATVKEGIRGLVGDLGSEADSSVTFTTVGPLEVRDAEIAGSIRIDFTSPVMSDEFFRHVTITPKVDFSSYAEGDPYFITMDTQSNERIVWRAEVYPKALEPSTTYTLEIKDLKDAHGQTLQKPYKKSFKTPPLSPRVFIHPEAREFSIFEKGKPPVYFLNQVNTTFLDLEFGKLSFDTFTALRKVRVTGNAYAAVDLRGTSDNYKTARLRTTAKQNTWEAIPFDLQKHFGTLAPGIYSLVLRSPEWKDAEGNQLYEERFFTLTNLGLTLKYSGNRLLAWVVDLQTGSPVSGANIAVRSLDGKVPLSGRTDGSGFFEGKISIRDFRNTQYDYQPEFWVTAEKDGDFAFIGSNWNSGFQPYDFDGVYSDFRSPETAKYRLLSEVHTDRPLYRAGDTVNFKGTLRLLDWDGKLTIPPVASRSAAVTVVDPESKTVYEKTLKLSDFGSFSDSFVSASEAPLGYYSLEAKLVPETDTEGTAYASFSVEAYRKPEYRAEAILEKEEYFAGETVKGSVMGSYYFGAPMAGADVAWRAYASDYYFNKVTDGWYSFALEDSWCWRDCGYGQSFLADGTGLLDASGTFRFQLPVSLDDKAVSQVVSFEADLKDSNNQVVSTWTSAIVHKSRVYVGIQPEEYGVPQGEEVAVKLITLTPEGEAAPNTSVTLSLYSRTWNTVREKGVDGEYYYNNEPVDTFIKSQTVRTGDDGKVTAKVMLQTGGEFRVVASAKDSSGRETKAGASLYAFESVSFNWPRSNNDRMEIVADKPMYKVGDTAKLLAKTPFQGKGVKALVTVERESVISKRVVDVDKNLLPIDVPITEELVPTAYVSVVVMKPRIGETFNEHGLDTGAPAFKIGYIKLPIDTESKNVTIEISTNKEKYLPRETVNVSLTAKDWKGNPIQTELSLGVVDMSLLDLAGFSMPDPVAQFYSERGLGVMTANMLTYLMERFKPGSKGGGGGEEDRTRGTFLDTAYWNPRIVTDKNGKAQASFTLPDNLTTWQLLAIGSTKDQRFGAHAETIIESKRVIVRPIRPRFAVIGDEIALGAIVHNYEESEKTFEVSLSGEGFTHEGKEKHSVKIAKDGSTKVLFPVSIHDAKSLTLKFLATTEGAKDEIIETIPVYPFGIDQSNATMGVTDDQVTEVVSIPEEADAPFGSLTVSLAPSVAVYLGEGLEFVSEFPYGCAEQVMSSFLPAVAVEELRRFEQFDEVYVPDLEKKVTSGLQQLYTFQRADGGFGYFTDSTQSYPYLTAYIVQGLELARAGGYGVDQGVLDRGYKYLRTAITMPEGYDDYVDTASRPYVLFILSGRGKVAASELNTLLKDVESLPFFSRAYLAMALKKSGMDGKAEEVLKGILSRVNVDARGARFEEPQKEAWREVMNTNARTTALALKALLAVDPDHALLEGVVRGMLSARHGGHWDTTQATAESILALVEYLKITKELEYDFTAAVSAGGKNVLSAGFKPPALEAKEKTLSFSDLGRGMLETKIGKKGTGRLYYDLLLKYFYTPDVIDPADEGIGILREVEPFTPADRSTRGERSRTMKVGTTHKVTLTITVPETRHFVAVESMLAAAFEPIDRKYATSQQLLFEGQENAEKMWEDYYKDQTWRFTRVEFRDDRVFLFADELPPGVYKYEYFVRATTPGRFHERPAKVWEMYYPETFGQTEGGWVEVKE